MAVLRVISLFLIVIALMLVGADVVSTLEKGGMPAVRSFHQILMLFRVNAPLWLQQNLAPQIAALLIGALSLPGWAVIGVPGAILGLGAARARAAHRAAIARRTLEDHASRLDPRGP